MKIYLKLSILAGAIFSLGVMSTMATPSPVNLDNNELGTVNSGSPASQADETGYLTTLLNNYSSGSFSSGGHTYTPAPGSSVPSASLPTSPVINVSQATGGVAGIVNVWETVTLTAGDDYALIKWGDEDEFYYVGGLTGTVTLYNDTGNGNGESHYDLWTATGKSVPDGGNTAILLGSVMVGFLAVTGFRKARA